MSWDCYLSLGANLGNRGETLRRALRMLDLLPDTKLVASSSFYTTLPWGKTDQPLFLNAAALVRTEMEPIYFLLACQEIENKLGRQRYEHWGARTCDIDLVYAPEVTSDTDALLLPHPYLTQRAFVLIPLQEIAPNLSIRPYNGQKAEARVEPETKRIAEWIQALPENERHSVMPAEKEISDPYPFSLIACMGADRGIGLNGELLFHIPEDMAFFKEKTMGDIVIMGRKTMGTMPEGKPLPGRINIVLSRTIPANVPVVGKDGAVRDAKQGADKIRDLDPDKDFYICPNLPTLWYVLGRLQEQSLERASMWVIGGSSVYAHLLPFCHEAWVTEVAVTRAADAFLPELIGLKKTDKEILTIGDGLRASYCHYQRK